MPLRRPRKPFYDDVCTWAEFPPIDRGVIRPLYRPEIRPGMPTAEVRAALGEAVSR